MLARHLHGLGAGDDPLISYTGASASYLDAEYLYTDRLGSVIARYRRDGTPAAINGYDEYGVPGPSSGVNNNGRFRYTGQVWLPELGLYYYKARMYSPTIGRFMQTDPIGYADGMNVYAYVGNDPVNGVDPTGLALTKNCTGTRVKRQLSYDCNGLFAGTGPLRDPTAGFDATLGLYSGHLGFSAGGGGGRGGSTPSCSGGSGNEIHVCGTPRQGIAAANIGDHLSFVGLLPQSDLPCPMAPDVARFYGDVREGAFERFQADGGDREIAYTIYRINNSGKLIAYFEFGTGASGFGPWRAPWRVAPTIDRPGLTPLLVGHIHDVPAGPCGLFCFSPRGASDGDTGSKAYYPPGTQFILHQMVFDEWEDSCF